MWKLREYQEKAKRDLRENFRTGKTKTIVWLSTGAGKGLMMADLADALLRSGNHVLTVMAGRDIVFQTKENYFKYRNIHSSVIMGNEPGFDASSPCQICSIDTLRARDLKFIHDFKFIIVDEIQHTNAPRYQDLFAKIRSDAFYVGYTATPYNNLKFWEHYTQPIKPHELRDQGFLVPVIHYAPKQIDVSEVKTVAGEYNQKQLADTSGKITGDIVQHWIKHGQNRPTICFGVDKAHSQSIADAFIAAGISAIHLDESDDKYRRKDAIERVRRGEIKILCNVNIFSTGVDIPELSCVISARPTKSEVLYIQQNGRALRPSPGKLDTLIFDHAGNIFRHGGVYDDREIRLANGKPKTEREIRVKTCPACMAVVSLGVKQCPVCKHVFTKIVEGREIISEDGTLEVIEDYMLLRLKTSLRELIEKENWLSWKKIVKYYKLFDKYGSIIFKYQHQLNIPIWFYQRMITEGKIKLEF